MSALRPVLREKRTSVEQAARTAARAIAEIGERVVCRFRGALTRLWRTLWRNEPANQPSIGRSGFEPAPASRDEQRGSGLKSGPGSSSQRRFVFITYGYA